MWGRGGACTALWGAQVRRRGVLNLGARLQCPAAFRLIEVTETAFFGRGAFTRLPKSVKYRSTSGCRPG